MLGGTAITGGIGSMVAVAGAALFLTHLGQMLKMLGLSTAFQFVIYGVAIALGMALAELKHLLRFLRRSGSAAERSARRPAEGARHGVLPPGEFSSANRCAIFGVKRRSSFQLLANSAGGG